LSLSNKASIVACIKHDDGRGVGMSIKTADILELSVAERIQMVEDIWDSIAAVPEAVLLSEDQKLELDRRLEAYHLLGCRARGPATGPPRGPGDLER